MERLAGRVILLWGWRAALTAFLAGALGAFAQAPFDFPAVMFIAFPVLVWLMDGQPMTTGGRWLRSLAGPFWLGWWFGFGYFLSGLWWIGNALLVEADAFAWAWPLAVVGLPALLAIFYGIATVIARLFWSDGLGRIAALAVGFGIAEWLRAFVFTGFPWNAVGYAAMPVPVMMQSLEIVGIFGMNALAVFVFALPAMLAARRGQVVAMMLLFTLPAAHLGYGIWRLSGATLAAEPVVNLRLVQPSIDQAEKWDAQVRDRIFQTYLEMTARPADAGAPTPTMVIWPETAVPFLFTDRPDALTALGETLAQGQTLLAGAVRLEGDPVSGRYYNSLLTIDEGGEIIDAFDKVHLVPFGEYMPLQPLLSRIGLSHLVQGGGPFEVGNQRRTLDVDGVRALPFLCYELIFPGKAGAHAGEADLLINVTNDAWFGNTPGPHQHLRQAQYRAVETRLPMARAANNGMSAVVDAYGRIVDGFGIDAVGVMDVAVPRHETVAALPVTPDQSSRALLALMALAAAAGRFARRKVD